MPHNHYFRDFIVSSGTKKTTGHTEDTEDTEDTENNYNSVISESSVVEYPYLEQ